MIRRTREERDALVSQWRASGKKMVDWCREQQIPITTFCGWAYAKKAPKGHAVAARSDFTELPGAGSLTSPSLQDFAGDLCKILASSELYFACITLPGPFSPFRSVFGRLRGPICRTFLLGNSWRYSLVESCNIWGLSSGRNSARKGEKGPYQVFHAKYNSLDAKRLCKSPANIL